MKKIFTTIVTALFAMTTFAQQSQQYFRVEFTVPITGDKFLPDRAIPVSPPQ